MIRALQAAGITALILLGAWAAETVIDTVRPRTALLWRLLVFLGVGVLILLLSLRVLGAAEPHPRDIHARFYSSWMMPDNPTLSCCHDQDCSPAASKFEHGRWLARRSDAEPWIPIPEAKIERNRDSPDGRSHLCGRRSLTEFTVFCFVRGSGA